MKKTVLFIFGTRPEAIKLAPVIKRFKESGLFKVKTCATAQHRQMLDGVLDFFSIIPDYDLNLMQRDQGLFDITARLLTKIKHVLEVVKPDLVFVQGDTTTAFTASLASFYKNIRVAHIEAGLRSFNKNSPFPEEINRILISHLAQFHFCPTKDSKENLFKEGVKNNVFVVGNTVIDALFLGLNIIKRSGEERFKRKFSFLSPSKKLILLTCHRRESFGAPMERVFRAVSELSAANKGIEVIYPIHLNPNVKKTAHRMLKGIKNIHLVEHLDYSDLLWIMSRCHLILTDSGGIQEEAPSLKKPILVLRDVTERTEGVKSGTAVLVGTDKEKIIHIASVLLSGKREYKRMAAAKNPYGDGKSSARIMNIMAKELKTM